MLIMLSHNVNGVEVWCGVLTTCERHGQGRAATCMIQPMTKTTKPRLTAVDALDTTVDSRKARLLIASWGADQATS